MKVDLYKDNEYANKKVVKWRPFRDMGPRDPCLYLLRKKHAHNSMIRMWYCGEDKQLEKFKLIRDRHYYLYSIRRTPFGEIEFAVVPDINSDIDHDYHKLTYPDWYSFTNDWE